MKMERNVYEEVQCAPPSEKYEESEIHTARGNYHFQVCDSEARNEALVSRKLPPEY